MLVFPERCGTVSPGKKSAAGSGTPGATDDEEKTVVEYIMWDSLIDFLKSGCCDAAPDRLPARTGGLVLRNYRTGAIPKERGVGALEISGGEVNAYAVFEDSDIFNAATEDNQQTWLTGDAMELFFQTRGREDYLELHVTPEEKRLMLHIPDYRTHRDLPWEEKIFSGPVRVQSRILRGQKLWCARITFPFELAGLAPETISGSRFAICRYNYTRPETEPEISSTWLLPDTGFHYPPGWHVIE